MNPKTVLKFAADNNARFVSVRFTDLPGAWHHITFPIQVLDEGAFENGYGFDASSLRGWAAINESDMLLIPDPDHCWMDPFSDDATLCLIANAVDPISRETYIHDPRAVAQRAEKYLKTTKLADVAYFGPEAEFFVFDQISFSNDPQHTGYRIESDEAHWSSGRSFSDELGPNQGYRVRHKEGYVPVRPNDSLVDLRNQMASLLQACGLEIERMHHEVATAGQCEINFRYSNLLRTADNMQLFKYIIRNTAYENGKTATFMPKPLYGDNGSGMHVHQSLWKGGKPLFAGNGYAGLSDMARYYIGGLLKHAPALAGLVAPTTNSYKRLVPGFEAPVNLAYSARNRSAAVRIPMFSENPKQKRLEFRPPDPACNPYLAFSALLLAGLDGIENKIEPGEPLDKDIYELSEKELKKIPSLPGSLDEALIALEKDHTFLLKGDVFTNELIERWIKYKREHEITPLRMRPHPLEFAMYYDV
ncbi:MAG: type I glutamate--ammonia ligase [Pyrinomonadaceae bacterium]